MRGNGGGGGRGTGRILVSTSNRGSGGGWRHIYTVDASIAWAKISPHLRPTGLCKWRERTAGRFGHWLRNHRSEGFIIYRVWYIDWVYDVCVSGSSRGGSSGSPLPTITTGRRTGRVLERGGLTPRMSIVDTFMSPPPRVESRDKKVLRLPDALAFC